MKLVRGSCPKMHLYNGGCNGVCFVVNPLPILAPVAYYRAVASYNPQLQSPNEDGAEEELGFLERDIIVVSGCVVARVHK